MKYVLFIALLLTLLACSDDTETPSPLTASLIANVTSGVAPLEVMFDASDSTGDIVSYQWDFGDGSTANGVQVQHTFSAGTFTVRLIVENEEGSSDEATTTLNVTAPNQAPEASFTFTPNTGNAPLEVQFDASASQDVDGEIVSYQWDFGDGNTATGVTPTHTFQSAGVFEVRLIVTDDNGANHESVEIIQVQSPNRAPIARMVISSEFYYPSYEGRVIVNLPPNDSTVEVTFDAATSEDADGDALTYQWDFGDGNTAEGMVVTHTYTFDPENDPSLPFRTVSLTVTDSRGASQQIEQRLQLSRASPLPSPNRAPVARMVITSAFRSFYQGTVFVSFLPNNPTVEVTFDAATSEDPDGDALTYQWDFGDGNMAEGDGNTAEGMVVTHTYAYDPENNPLLTVTLTVTDSRGASQQIEQPLRLTPLALLP